MSFYLEISNDRIKDDIESLTKVLKKGKFMFYLNDHMPKILIILFIIILIGVLIIFFVRNINKYNSHEEKKSDKKEKYNIVKARIEKEKEKQEEKRKAEERKKKEENHKNNIFEPMCDNVNYMSCLSDMPNSHKIHCNNLKNSCGKPATKQCDMINYNLCKSKVSGSLNKSLYCRGYIKDCL